MKRDHKLGVVEGDVTIFWPWLFWYPCISCDRDFRREWGWKVVSEWIRSAEIIIYKYVCSDCAKTKQQAYDIVNKPIQRPVIDPPPQPPPQE